MNNNNHLGIFIYKNRDGGVEKMLVNLAKGCDKQGIKVDLLVSYPDAPFLSDLPPGIQLIEIGDQYLRTLPLLRNYLRKERPDTLLTGKPSDDRIMLRAKKIAFSDTRCFSGTGTAVSRQLDEMHNTIRKRIKLYRKKRHYQKVDGIIATSKWVAHDIAKISGIPEHKINIIGNPIFNPDEITLLANKPVDHPSLFTDNTPVILSVGRLSFEKDFKTLIHAFSHVKKNIAAKLLILGEGPEREALQALARKLGLENDVILPGFCDNPLRYMAKAHVFALTSLWEGFGNVLVEAMATGTPIVSTDCPGGPREILKNGLLGHLVPVGDAQQMAAAILSMLNKPTPKETLITASQDYSIDKISRRYIEILGLKTPA